MSAAPPPPALLIEFVSALNQLVAEWGEGFNPVLRGSLLLHHWYGDRARPPADIDLECFVRPNAPREYDPEEEPYLPMGDAYGPVEGRFGSGGDFVSRVDFGKAMCRYAVRDSEYEPRASGIVFRGVETPPPDGASLWVYGTPGKRYYANWQWAGHRPDSGRLQIDLATPGPYTPDDLGVTNEPFVAPGNVTFQAPAYSKEAMLAAKVSWLVRGLTRTDDGTVTWAGEPKDLFDAHLLSGDESLRPDVFRRAMLGVGAGDALNWNALHLLFEFHRAGATDAAFGNWKEFARRDLDLAPAGPAVLWAELVERLEPLFGDLYPAAEMPLLMAVNALPADRLPLLVYADWLDERDDPRGKVARLVAEVWSTNGLSADQTTRREVAAALAGTSQPWLHQLFGTSARLRAFREAVGAA
jgi:uncharacterized protein (TIGR02996 family)